ncbi:MAG: hypothetical protein ACJ750_12860, partial [Gaiellaceae bacterium]
LADVTQRLGVPLPGYTVAPVWEDERPYYGLFVERGSWNDVETRSVLAAFDRELSDVNDEYRGKRQEDGLRGPIVAQTSGNGLWKEAASR